MILKLNRLMGQETTCWSENRPISCMKYYWSQIWLLTYSSAWEWDMPISMKYDANHWNSEVFRG